ncbi:MAG: hypothetical protein Phog2KO_29200 [Phototrophicaceae bacterium]
MYFGDIYALHFIWVIPQVALTTILVSVLVLWFPNLETMHDDLLLIVAAILMVALGGYSVGDALNYGKPDSEPLDDLLDHVADDLGLDEPDTEAESEVLNNAQA